MDFIARAILGSTSFPKLKSQPQPLQGANKPPPPVNPRQPLSKKRKIK